MGDPQHTAAPLGLAFFRRAPAGAEASARAAIWALLLAALFREVTGTPTLFHIGSFNLNAADPAFFLACFAALRCWLDKPPNINAVTIPALLLVALACVAVTRGGGRNLFLSLFWLRTAGFLAPLLIIGATLRPDAETFAAIRRAIFTVGILLALLVLLRATIDMSLFFTVDFDDPAEINDGNRAIGNSGAMILAMASVLATAAILRPTRSASPGVAGLLALFLAGLLISAQVTAIIATLAALLALVMLERPFGDRSIVGLAGTAIIGALYVSFASWSDLLPPVLRDTLRHRSDNLGTRRAVWDGFTARYATLSPVDQMIGIPAGSDPALIVLTSGHWRPWQNSLHSMYVGTMSELGLIGLCAYLALLVAGLVLSAFLLRTKERIGCFTPALSIAFLVLAAIESYSYDLQQERLLVLLPPLLLLAQARRIRPPSAWRAAAG